MSRLFGRRSGVLALLVLAFAAMIFAAACGGDDDADAKTGEEGGVTVRDAWARPSSNTIGAAYLVVENKGSSDDRLLRASADLSPKVQVHEVVTSGLTQQMQEVKDGIVVPAGGSVELKPGGYHIMLMDLPKPLEVGETVVLTLEFEKAGSMEVRANVEEPDPNDDHSHHDHDDHDDEHDDDDHGDHS